MRGVARALPPGADESARLWPAFVEYRLLALSAFAYYISIWADKIVVYLVKGGDAAAFYAAIAAVAWFSVIPAFAWIYVQIETTFYQRFRSFYAELEAGAPLRELKQHAELISVEAKHILRGAAAVQMAATALVIAAAPRVVAIVGLSPDATPLFRLAALGAGLQVFSLLEVLLLTYFDLRRDALVICGCLLVGVTALTVVCCAVGWPPVLGHLVACAISAVARPRARAPPAGDAGAGHLPVTAIRRCLNRSRGRGAPRSTSTAPAAAPSRAVPAASRSITSRAAASASRQPA